MTRLVASDYALRALLLLSQRGGGIRTSEVADALGISYTGAEKALDILVDDGLAKVSEHRYSFSGSPRAQQALGFGLAFLRPEEAVAALARGNQGVEFVGTDRDGMSVVFRRFIEPDSERRFREGVDRLLELAPDTKVAYATKEDLRDTPSEDLSARQRAQAMKVLVGSVDRTFPDRTQHGDFDARPLGRLSSEIRAPSASRMRDFARTHGLRRILAFGSATREDFRPDSDIDLLVEPVPGRRFSLTERVDLLADAERLFDRDVDILTAPVRRSSLSERISRDGVVLYDAAR